MWYIAPKYFSDIATSNIKVVTGGVLKISQNLQENTCARVSFLTKLQASACKFNEKETLA